MLTLSWIAALGWVCLLMLPWQPWRNRELLAATGDLHPSLHDLSVVIPARNEAQHLSRVLSAANQGPDVQFLVVDDNSTDDTAAKALSAARRSDIAHLRVIDAPPLARGWSGKVWAQNAAAQSLDRPLVLLLDADIVLAPGIIARARDKLLGDDLDLVSVMAQLRMSSLWEKLLIPPFIYFFKLLYPFALSNRRDSRVAAAAGGFILMRRCALERIGGFHALRGELIDDCALARLVKHSGGGIWVGQSLDVRSTRSHDALAGIWQMVSRTAFTQLRRSIWLLLLTTALMVTFFVAPVLAVMGVSTSVPTAGIIALAAMAVSFAPCVLLYRLHPGWIATLPLAACLFTLMTWHSAWRWWCGETAVWRGRHYPARCGSDLG